jgi:hypothetical protein
MGNCRQESFIKFGEHNSVSKLEEPSEPNECNNLLHQDTVQAWCITPTMNAGQRVKK